jgi:FtsP/CotA-like multicopper oxidase with cupredoxin domain
MGLSNAAVESTAGALPTAGRAEFVAPDSAKLSWEIKDGRKEFHLIAGVVRTEFLPGRPVDAWGYNGMVPGPVIEIDEGDRVRIVVDNHLPEPTSMHWHGLEIPVDMDGAPGISQDPIPPGGRFVYEFDIHQSGTFFYHSHMPMQEMMGMIGFFVIHPRKPEHPVVDRDFGLILQEWDLRPNNTVPNTLAMEFNWLTMNGKAGPATTPMIARTGERVRIRLVNLGMDHHPIHLHGNTFVVTGSEAGRAPESTWAPGNTVLVGVAQARDIEFDAKYEGDWMVHCHMPHHGMNQMVSMVGPMMRKGGMPGMNHGASAPAPGYPQDMWMVMDADYASKPECYGLRAGWTGGMMGMMTLIRVVPPELYDKIEALRASQGSRPTPPRAPAGGHEHGHHS